MIHIIQPDGYDISSRIPHTGYDMPAEGAFPAGDAVLQNLKVSASDQDLAALRAVRGVEPVTWHVSYGDVLYAALSCDLITFIESLQGRG